jgi:hypothetical protein
LQLITIPTTSLNPQELLIVFLYLLKSRITAVQSLTAGPVSQRVVHSLCGQDLMLSIGKSNLKVLPG